MGIIVCPLWNNWLFLHLSPFGRLWGWHWPARFPRYEKGGHPVESFDFPLNRLRSFGGGIPHVCALFYTLIPYSTPRVYPVLYPRAYPVLYQRVYPFIPTCIPCSIHPYIPIHIHVCILFPWRVWCIGWCLV
jgi:hypothetical protein